MLIKGNHLAVVVGATGLRQPPGHGENLHGFSSTTMGERTQPFSLGTGGPGGGMSGTIDNPQPRSYGSQYFAPALYEKEFRSATPESRGEREMLVSPIRARPATYTGVPAIYEERLSAWFEDRLSAWFPEMAITLLFLYNTVPSTLNLILGGRGSASGSGALNSIIESGFALVVGRIILSAYLILCVITVLIAIRSGTKVNFLAAALVITPWIFTYVISSIRGTGFPSFPAWMFPIGMIAFATSRISMRTFRLIGALTLILSVTSNLMGLLTPFGLMNNWVYGQDKAIISGNPLAGPFSHSNILGLALAIGLPFIFAFRKPICRWLAIGVVVETLVWSASRTGLVAGGVALASYVVIRWFGAPATRAILATLLVVAGGLIMLIPYLDHDEAAFTGRGLIWENVIYASGFARWFGYGPSAFDSGPVVNRIGYATTHGHNIFMTYLLRGGLVVAASIAVMFIVVAWRSLKQSAQPPVLGLGVLALLTCGTLEGAFEIGRLPGFEFVTWGIVGASIATFSESILRDPNKSLLSSRSPRLRGVKHRATSSL